MTEARALAIFDAILSLHHVACSDELRRDLFRALAGPEDAEMVDRLIARAAEVSRISRLQESLISGEQEQTAELNRLMAMEGKRCD